jgi:hypothetical protein
VPLTNTGMADVELDKAFVPGAQLDEPLEAHTVEALRMWLIHVCHVLNCLDL